MIGLTDLDLAQMRLDNIDIMANTCVILTRSDSQDSTGQPIASWTEAATTACGFEPLEYRFRTGEVNVPGEETSEIVARCRLPITYYSTISQNDRVRITHRYGEALSTTETFEVEGFAERGPSAFILNLRRVEL